MQAAKTGDEFRRYFGGAAAICAALLLLPAAGHYSKKVPSFSGLEHLVWELRNGELNADDFQALAAGYYEGLENKAQIAKGTWNKENNDYQMRDDFLRYEYRANIRRQYPAGMRVTNSLGMPNAEYGPAKPAHTRRIALLGDSVSVGPFGHSYELLLEQKLNECCRTAEVEQYQVLNFAVPGYVSVQGMDVALNRAKDFHPDVYLMTLTEHEIRGVALHIAALEANGADLKYDFLKKIVAQAGIQPSDRRPVIVKKLDPYWKQMTAWAIEQVRDKAKAQGAPLVVLLIPVPDYPNVQAEGFEQFHRILQPLGVPVLDLRNAYQSASDLDELQVAPGDDDHPNVRGHRMLFDELYKQLEAQPDAMRAVLGR